MSHGSRLERRTAAADAGERLVDVLARWLREELPEPVPMARVRALVAAGGVRVDGAVVRAPGRPLRSGQHVAAQVRPELLRGRALALDRPFQLTAHHILLDDGLLLAVDKPPGLPTHATADRSRPSLVTHVERYRRELGQPATLAVHQRLDRDTSGVVLFGVDPRANAGLARAFAGRLAEKTYLALTARPRKLAAHRFRISAPVDGKAAVTEVVVHEVLDAALLVEAHPLTGRRHQVRAHLAHAGLPVLGDAVYGGAPVAGPQVPRLMLHAWRLVLPHPLSAERLVIESPLPADFTAVLTALRKHGPGRSSP